VSAHAHSADGAGTDSAGTDGAGTDGAGTDGHVAAAPASASASAGIAAWLERFRRGDRLALARLMSLAARGEGLGELEAALPPLPTSVRVAAITGGAGVGKSTLVGKLIEAARRHGRKVAVLACDPQSPLSGGALLGDRFRMNAPLDEDVFIRSLAAHSGHEALADHLPVLLRLAGSFGFDLILLETVGAGQGDTAVRDVADVVVLLLQPETGDDLQWEKAGVLEVADIIVVHKRDLPGAEQTAAQVRGMLGLARRAAAPVLLASSKSGEGIDELYEAILAPAERARRAGRVRAELTALLQQAVSERLERALEQPTGEVRRLVERWQTGELSSASAVEHILRLLSDSA
jgi:LAO/AO transport system ATPase